LVYLFAISHIAVFRTNLVTLTD